MGHRPPRTILVAVDFGEASARAARLAGRLAAALDATLEVVHADVLEVPPYFTREQVDAIERERELARATAEEDVRRFVDAQTDRATGVSVVEGPPAEVVLDAARRSDLVVMGTHGRRGPSRWWLGSVAERVVRDSEVPVLVVHSAPPMADPTSVVVLEPAGDGGEARHWADAIAGALGVAVRYVPSAVVCQPVDLASAALVVVEVPDRPAHRALHDSVVALARTCSLPTLFVPAGTRSGASPRVW